MDFLRETVVDHIRPFRDSDLVVPRRWYRVPEGTPLLGVPSAFLSARWEPFPWFARKVGEVYPDDVRYQRYVAPPGMPFDHFCGTRDQWANGAEFDPDFNSHPDEFWIPRCCGRVVPPGQGVMEIGGECGDKFIGVDPTAGGVELGGAAGDLVEHVDPTAGGVELGGAAGESREYTDPTAGGVELGGAAGESREYTDPTAGGVELGGAAGDLVEHVDPTAGGVELGGAAGESREYTDPTAGGVELGGAAGDLVEHVDPTAGGVELGGAAGDVFTAPVVPGATCATAGPIPVGGHYTGTVTLAGSDDWFSWNAVGGTQYTVTITAHTGGTLVFQQKGLGTCSTSSIVAGPTVSVAPAGGANSYTPAASAQQWIQVYVPSGPDSTYTLTLTSP